MQKLKQYLIILKRSKRGERIMLETIEQLEEEVEKYFAIDGDSESDNLMKIVLILAIKLKIKELKDLDREYFPEDYEDQ